VVFFFPIVNSIYRIAKEGFPGDREKGFPQIAQIYAESVEWFLAEASDSINEWAVRQILGSR